MNKFGIYDAVGIIFILFALPFSFVVFAEGMSVKPGLWEITSSTSLPSGQGNQEYTSQECIEEKEMTPDKLMEESEGCEILESSFTDDSMQWSMRCESSGMVMNGEGNAQSSGNSLSGGMQISATFEGQEMMMSTEWAGVYKGNCN